MRTQPVHHRHLLAAAICLCLAPAAFAAQPEVNAEREAITVGTEAAAYTLRLSYPDGRSSERVMLAGESFAIDAASPGGLLADGVYQFEAHPITGLRERADGDAVPQATKTAHAPMAAESGSFQVYQGRIVVADSEAPKQGDQDFGVRMKDQVIPDDLIVQSSACVGQDCVNGENFGFDTLRLKENNLRLHFDDTSSSGSFPSNDWTLIANDSSNGGANYFAIEDRTAGRHVFEVRAGAPANSLFVDASGRIGIKTSTPVVNLHVAEGNTPAIRLEQNGSSGFTAQTWDVAGNEANFFVRDVTNGSRLPFKIKPGAPTDSLFIGANGNIALGSANPTAKLDVYGTTNLRANAASLSFIGIDHSFFQWFPNGFSSGRKGYMGFGDPSLPTLSLVNEANTGNVVVVPGSGGFLGVNTFSPTSPLDVAGNRLRIRNSLTPASSNAACSQGEISWDPDYVYVCVANNLWRRSALSPF